MFDFLKPKKDKNEFYVVVETHYPEFIDNVKIYTTKKDIENNVDAQISEYEFSTQSPDTTKMIYVFKEKQ